MTPVEALQAALAGEHAAVYLYGVLAGQTSIRQDGPQHKQWTQDFITHRARRDALIDLITKHGAVPVGSLATYVVPPNTAATVEERLMPVYAQVVEFTTGSDRAWAFAALSAVAVAAVQLGVAPTAFPGAS